MYAAGEYPRIHPSLTPLLWLTGLMNMTTTTPLTVADRCDRCGAQAYVRVTLPVGELLFCAHHSREHAAKYSEIAVEIQDETDRLLEEHGAGAGAAQH